MEAAESRSFRNRFSAGFNHRHLRNIDCLTARTACLVSFISTVNGCSKRKRKRKRKQAY
jgi:hypothetical protein